MGYEEFQAGARHNSTTLYDTSTSHGAKRTSIGESSLKAQHLFFFIALLYYLE